MISDLNSVILEGEIVMTLPLDKDTAPEKLQLRSLRIQNGVSHQNYFMVDIRHNATVIREELGLGKKIRVVGRLVNAKHKSVVLHAEHIEIKPAYSTMKPAFA